MELIDINEHHDTNKRFDLSKHGFLRDESTPLTMRPPYDTYVNIANQLKELIESHKIEEVILSLPLIAIDDKTTLSEYQTLYTMLCLIQASYIWHNGENNHHQKVPMCIAMPLHQVSSYLGIAPILTHGAVDLYNWRLIDENSPFELDNIKSAFTLTGDASEERFYLVMVAIEHEGRLILDEANKIPVNASDAIKCLQVIDSQLDKIMIIMKRMYEKCESHFFYNVLRIFFTGWSNTSLFPNGMELENIGTNFKHGGGSAAQSTLIQVIDAMLGVTHETGFLKDMRSYMPIKHREYVEWVESRPNCKSWIDDDEVRRWHSQCIEKLVQFRKIHMGFIHNYILKEAKIIAESNPDKKSALSVEGTGGTKLVEESGESALKTMLEELITETKNAK